MTSKLVVNTIEADTGISSVSFASSISLSSTSKFHFSAAGIDIDADTNINRPAAGVLGFNISGAEKLRIDTNGHLNTSGIVTAANFKTGVTNLHSTGLTLTGGQLDVGSNIKVGTAGVITATSFVGSGANLTGITGTTINNNGNNRIITGSSTANTLEAEDEFTYNNQDEVALNHVSTNENSYLSLNANANRRKTLVFKNANAIQGSIGLGDSDELTSTTLFLSASANVGGASPHMVITSTGNVGVGTNNPTEKFNVFGTNVKPVIGHKTDHTPHYSSYDSQNNTTLEISSSGTGTNVSGLALNNPTTAANTSYKTITFCCSGTSSAEKRGAIIGSNHDEDSSSTVKGNFYVSTNNGSGLQQNLQINHDGHVTKPNQPFISLYLQANDVGGTSNRAGNDTTLVPTGVRTNIGSHYNNSNGRFTCPVDGLYEVSFSSNIALNQISGTVISMQLHKNGSIAQWFYSQKEDHGTWWFQSWNHIIDCNANDYLTVVNKYGNFAVDSSIYWNYFSFRLVQ